jgi:hypothetical protein
MCDCAVLAALRHAYFGSLMLDPEDIKILSLGAIWNFSKRQASLKLVSDYGEQGACFKIKVHMNSKGPNSATNLRNLTQLSVF